MSVADATTLIADSVKKSARWSGNELVYLNALWDAAGIVAAELGFVDEEYNRNNNHMKSMRPRR